MTRTQEGTSLSGGVRKKERHLHSLSMTLVLGARLPDCRTSKSIGTCGSTTWMSKASKAPEVLEPGLELLASVGFIAHTHPRRMSAPVVSCGSTWRDKRLCPVSAGRITRSTSCEYPVRASAYQRQPMSTVLPSALGDNTITLAVVMKASPSKPTQGPRIHTWYPRSHSYSCLNHLRMVLIPCMGIPLR